MVCNFGSGLLDELRLIFEKFSGCDSDECGVDAVSGVGEKEVSADWFDVEVDGGTDQELIVLGDGEIVDGVVSIGEAEAI